MVYENAKGRPIIFSTFQPDAALLMKKLQHTYPVSTFAYLFITDLVEVAIKTELYLITGQKVQLCQKSHNVYSNAYYVLDGFIQKIFYYLSSVAVEVVFSHKLFTRYEKMLTMWSKLTCLLLHIYDVDHQ